MKTSNQLFLLGVLSALSAAAAAADSADSSAQAPVDPAKWECKSCPFEQGSSGTLDVGIGNVSDKSSKFGDYTGLDKDGGFFIGDGSMRSRGEEGTYWNANASNLGLKSRSLDAEGGEQGGYKLIFKYDELPHLVSDSAQTPFIGNGGASLTLPAGFAAPTTSAMALAGNLQQVNIGTDRKRLSLGGSWIAAVDWEYAVNIRHETREGSKRTAGAFFVNAAQLVEPVDYVTDQVDVSAAYTGSKWQAKFAYYGSVFRNGNDSLTWQNPFSVPVPLVVPAFAGIVTGQLALPPNNQFHQVLASVGYDFGAGTRANADIALGRMTQNEGFLQSTQIPGLNQGRPANSLNGRVATLDANLKFTSAITDQLRLNAVYTHNDRDNQTPQSTYNWVSTDLFSGGAARTNLPYSFTQDKLKLSGEYRVSPLTRASAGIDHDSKKRTFQETDKTREGTFWGKVTTRILDEVDVTFKLARGERTNSGYQAVAAITPPENPLLRKYTMADRTRDSAGLRADFAAAENINVGLGLDSSEDKYKGSTIGLISGKDYTLYGDVSMLLTEQTSLHFFANYQEIRSKQAGSESFPAPDWSGQNNDKIDFFGIGVKHAAIKDKLDIGADYGITRSRSEIIVNTGGADSRFPNISTSLDSLKLYASYRMNDKVSLQAGYWHERYDSRNWMLDGVAPGTIQNVLSFGEQAPRYNVNVIKLSVRYKF